MDESHSIIKFIIDELSKDPFRYEFNVVSFESLKPDTLLMVLHNVLSEIDPNYKKNSVEAPTDIFLMMDLLRILRFFTAENSYDSTFQALEEVDKEAIWEIIAWLLVRKDELRQRAYLATYLVKIQIPEDIMLDEEVADLYDKYESKIDQFIEVHKSLQHIQKKMEVRPVGELLSDLERITHDVECLTRKVDSLKTRVRNNCNSTAQVLDMLEQAREIRKARESKLVQAQQIQSEEEKLSLLFKKQELLHTQLSDIQELSQYPTPDTALIKMEQDAEMLMKLVEDKLPQRISQAKRVLLAYRITEENPPVCRADLEYRRAKIESVRKEISSAQFQLKEREQADPTMAYAREQSSRLKQKKASLQTELNEKCRVFSELKITAEEKKLERQCVIGEDCELLLDTVKYREYVKEVRFKSSQYKSMKTELQSLQSEMGNLSVTRFILDGELKDSLEEVKRLEKKFGVVGFSGMLEKPSQQTETCATRNFEGINELVADTRMLNMQIAEKKCSLEPTLRALADKKKKLQEMAQLWRESKRAHDIEVTPIFSDIRRLEDDITVRKSLLVNDECCYTKMTSEIPVLKTELLRTKCMTGQGPFARSTIDILRGKILESERIKDELLNESSHLDDCQEYQSNQLCMWTNLIRLLEAKVSYLQKTKIGDISE